MTPWLPIFVTAFAISMSTLGRQSTHTLHIWFEPDGSKTEYADFTSLESQILRVAAVLLPLSFIAFAVGIVILMRAFLRTRRAQPRNSSNQAMQRTADRPNA